MPGCCETGKFRVEVTQHDLEPALRLAADGWTSCRIILMLSNIILRVLLTSPKFVRIYPTSWSPLWVLSSI